jgi:phosphoribosyl-AMP cyclohydrolase / phosphoribosyl-ATP pyrophosphohydrolase
MSLGLEDIDSLDWSKSGGLIPGVVQDVRSEAVLMLGFLSPESLRETFLRGRIVFYSRTRERLWEKGETSGNYLELVAVEADCDHDSLLLRVRAAGPACHRQTLTCFGEGDLPESEGVAFLGRLDAVIQARIAERPEGSYTARLFAEGTRRIAQKVGEEGVEAALAGNCGNEQELVSEAADLVFHLALLLRARGLSLSQVAAELAARHRTKTAVSSG